MKKMKSLLDQFDQAQIISSDDAKKITGGGWGFIYRGIFSCGWFCRKDDGDD